jgi:hypothetical protein
MQRDYSLLNGITCRAGVTNDLDVASHGPSSQTGNRRQCLIGLRSQAPRHTLALHRTGKFLNVLSCGLAAGKPARRERSAADAGSRGVVADGS